LLSVKTDNRCIFTIFAVFNLFATIRTESIAEFVNHQTKTNKPRPEKGQGAEIPLDVYRSAL